MSSPLPRTSTARTSGTRATLGALVAVLASLLVLVGSAGSASAESGYRYWNYSHLEGDTFAFAQTGPGDVTPKDGAVEGWRYGTSTVSQGVFPRADLSKVDFDAVCGDTDAAAGEKRVAVLIDYGTQADADGADVPDPRAECAVAPKDATGQQVLDSVVDIRADQGMICALDGYPAQGCGAKVRDAQVSSDEQTVAFTLPATADDTKQVAAEEDTSSKAPLLGVVGVLIALAGIALVIARRKRNA